EGAYTADLELDTLLADALGGGGDIPTLGDQNPVLARIRFAVNVDTLQPVVVSNNVAELEAEAHVQLVGTYYSPGLMGRVFIAEGGQVELQETQFVVTRGIIDFTSAGSIEPVMDITADTST